MGHACKALALSGLTLPVILPLIGAVQVGSLLEFLPTCSALTWGEKTHSPHA
jgi:hypothetical protein